MSKRSRRRQARRAAASTPEAPKPPAPPAPGNVLLDDIPGLREAMATCAREVAALRELAFLPEINIDLCGLAVQQLRPRHWGTLAVLGNPFVVGGSVTAEAVAQFIWVVSVHYAPDSDLANAFRAHAEINEETFAHFADGIDRYIDDAFVDRAAGDGGGAPRACVTAYITHDLARVYKWSRERIDKTPFGAIFQHLRLISDDEHRAAGQRPPPTIGRELKVRRMFIQQYFASLENG